MGLTVMTKDAQETFALPNVKLCRCKVGERQRQPILILLWTTRLSIICLENYNECEEREKKYDRYAPYFRIHTETI